MPLRESAHVFALQVFMVCNRIAVVLRWYVPRLMKHLRINEGYIRMVSFGYYWDGLCFGCSLPWKR